MLKKPLLQDTIVYSFYPIIKYPIPFFLREIDFSFCYCSLCWVFVAACGLSLAAASGGHSSCRAWASHHDVFACCGAQALGLMGLSSYSCQTVECGLSRSDAWAQLPCGIWDLPGPGTKPMSSVLSCGLFPTGPPRKPRYHISCSSPVSTLIMTTQAGH